MNATRLLKTLRADDIRRRLDELSDEQKAMRTLLRAALQRERTAKSKRPATEARP